MKEYKHTQIGYLLITALGAAVLLIGNLTVTTNFNPTAIVLFVFMLLCLIVFATLTVEVNDQAINIKFGIGVIRKQFELKDFQTYHAVKNPWYYAWGIHVIPGGWIFNVSGWEAVELQMKDGKKYRIGTDDVHGLVNAVAAHRQKMQS